MYYFEKDRRAPRATYPVSFDRQWRYFDFRPLLVHRENREAFSRWFSEFRPALPDFLGAVVSQMHYKRHLDHRFIVEAIEYCRTMIEERGFERTNLRDLALAPPEINHVMLVAGCQGPAVRKARVQAAFYVLSRLPRHINVRIVFSGRNPAEPPTRIHVLTHDEATDMEREFDALVDHDQSFREHRNFTVHREREARTSSENLGNFFSGDYLKDSDTAYLYIVSSTFHLRRLADEAEKCIAVDERLKETIAKVVLIGAEKDPNDEPVMLEPYYVKNMMFEVFLHMFTNSPIGPLSPTEYEGTV